MIPALLKWIGNKQRFAKTIVSYIPNEFNNYYEPFLGSGAVMAELLSSDKVFNTSYGSDILPFLIEIFNAFAILSMFSKETFRFPSSTSLI